MRTSFTLSLGYFSQVYSAISTIVFAPFILKSIGPEAYGLVGIYLIAQGWMQLLDAGLTPSTTRETARYHGKAISGKSLANTILGLEVIIGIVMVPLFLFFWALSGYLVEGWLHRENLTLSEVTLSVNIMIGMFAMRWASGIRKGVLQGAEKHAHIYGLNILVSSLRYPCIVLYFKLFEPTVTNYFFYQLTISFIEIALLWAFSHPLVPRELNDGVVNAVKSVRNIAGFALNHSYLAFIWICITQTDKLILSAALSLSDFGHFTLAIAASAGVRIIAQPIGQILKPRLTRLYAADKKTEMINTFRLGTRFAVVTLSGLTATLLLFGYEMMLAWTDDSTIAEKTAVVLAFYSFGNAVLLMGTFTYYLQFAAGELRNHRIGSTVMFFILLPTMYFAAQNYGMEGTALAWALIWIMYLATWLTYCNSPYLKGQHLAWLFRDIVATFLPALFAGFIIRHSLTLSEDRLMLLLQLVAITLFCTFLSFLASGLHSIIWQKVFRR